MVDNMQIDSEEKKVNQKMMKLNNGLQIPQIGFGTLLVDESKTIVDALKIGYRLIDTAEMFENEEIVGQGCKQAMKDFGLKREEIFVITKIPPYKMPQKQADQCIKDSLQKLDLEYIDLLMINLPGLATSNNNTEMRKETWEIMESFVKEGTVKSLGVSNFLVKHIEEILGYAKIKPVVNQIQIHPMFVEQELVNYCRQKDILVQAYAPFAKWHFQVMQHKDVTDIAKQHKKDVAQIVLAYLTGKGYAVVPKSSTFERMESNFNCHDFKLSQDNIEKLDKLAQNKVSVSWNAENLGIQ